MATGDDDAVRSPLERPEDEEGVDPAGAGHPDDLHVGRIGKAAGAGKVSAGIAAPVAAKRHDQGLIFLFGFFYRHIASTSAMICLVEKPFRSIAPEGQVTVQAPQP